MRKLQISNRIVLLLLLNITSMAVIIFLALHALNTTATFLQNTMQDKMVAGEKKKIMVATHSMAIILGEAVRHAKDEAEQVTIIRQMVENIRFEQDKSGYYYVYKGTTNVALPTRKDLVGKDLAGLKDTNGVYYVKEMAEAAKKDGRGFVSLIFSKPDQGDVAKINYIETIPGTPFYIGTGIYLDNVEKAREAIKAETNSVKAEQISYIGVFIVCLLVFLVPVCILVVRSIIVPLRQTVLSAEKIAQGDLDTRLAVEGRDELSKLQKTLREMVLSLKKYILEAQEKTRYAQEETQKAQEATTLAEAATQKAQTAKSEGMRHAGSQLEGIGAEIKDASSQITQQTNETVEGVNVQKERIQTTTTAMEEMNSTVLEVARNAADAATNAQQAREMANEGETSVQKSVTAINAIQTEAVSLRNNMGELEEKAQAIGNIMSVITDIADQTNLLALNAAIEAARAGEAGRGFAVVADEVRKLAEKTMTATKEVGDSITSIQTVTQQNANAMNRTVNDLEEATELANASGEVLRKIVQGSEMSADQIQSIATAAEQQSATSEEITQALEEINRIALDTDERALETREQLLGLNAQMDNMTQLIKQLKNA